MDAVPTYRLRFEEREHYLFAHVQAAEIKLELECGYMREVADKCDALGATRCMVLRDIPEVLCDSGQFNIAREAMEMFRNIKICWVNPYAANQASLDFASMVATNRGGEFRMFGTEIDAEKWLRSP
ncbi:MAG: hypothetical protein ACJ73D_04025 [Pyrinomonadaceae bacterium]